MFESPEIFRRPILHFVCGETETSQNSSRSTFGTVGLHQIQLLVDLVHAVLIIVILFILQALQFLLESNTFLVTFQHHLIGRRIVGDHFLFTEQHVQIAWQVQWCFLGDVP